MITKYEYDVLIIGGSYAGLSAALQLGRSLRRVLVIDAGQPCNRQTPHSHGFLTRDGQTPAELSAIAREQLSRYPTVQLWSGKAIAAGPVAGGFSVTAESVVGAERVTFTSRKILLATGVADIMPDLPGFAECWGRSVLHCPYCHGYEVHSQPLGILANGETGYEMATLIQQWSPRLTVYTNGPATLTPDQRHQLDQLQVAVVEQEVAAIEHQDGMMTALRFTDGTRVHPTAIFSRVPFRHHTDLASQLGCTLTENGLIQATEFGETNVPGVYAAGDITNPFRQVALAVANGSKAVAWMNRVMIAEDIKQRTNPLVVTA
jgi:thioredoxin reductase